MLAHNVPAYIATRKWRELKVSLQVAITSMAESAVYDCIVVNLWRVNSWVTVSDSVRVVSPVGSWSGTTRRVTSAASVKSRFSVKSSWDTESVTSRTHIDVDLRGKLPPIYIFAPQLSSGVCLSLFETAGSIEHADFCMQASIDTAQGGLKTAHQAYSHNSVKSLPIFNFFH